MIFGGSAGVILVDGAREGSAEKTTNPSQVLDEIYIPWTSGGGQSYREADNEELWVVASLSSFFLRGTAQKVTKRCIM